MASEKLDTAVRREQLVGAALNVIGTDGVRRLSVGRLARRVGLVPSAFYRHFTGKDEVIEAVLQHIRDSLREILRTVRAETADPLEQLRRLLGRHLAMVRDNGALPRVVFSEDVYFGRPDRRARMFRGIQRYLDEVAAIVEEGQKTGRIRASVDPQAVASLFLGLIQPGAILWHMSDGAFDVTRRAERGWRLLEEALRVEPASRRSSRRVASRKP